MSSAGYLVFDTETNGLHDPRLASIGLIFISGTFQRQFEHYTLIKPTGWTMDVRATAVNGLTDERLETEGRDIRDALAIFRLAVVSGRTIVAHHAAFDMRVMDNEASHQNVESWFVPDSVFCTMEASRVRFGYGGLAKVYEHLFGIAVQEEHHALADARACLRIFQHMVEWDMVTA